jgi:fumarate hydratase class II
LNAHPEFGARMIVRLSESTGWALELSDNLFESMQSMADLVDFSAALRTLALTLIRIANDVRLLASGPTTGLDEIRLPAVQPGSSIMPGKVNPVMAEMLDMAMYHVIGCDTTVALASQAGQLELNVMMPILAHNLFEMMHVMIGSIHLFTRRAVVGMQANAAQAEAWLAHNPIVATALNPLVGYAAAAELVKSAAAKRSPIREEAAAWIAAGRLVHRDDPGRKVTLEELDAVLSDLRRMTDGGLPPEPSAASG